MPQKRIRTDAARKADKKYNDRSITLTVTYRPTNIIDGQRVKRYLADTGQSANSYIQSLIRADLDAKNIPYPEKDD